jgi:hypothetical protein
LRTLLIDDLRVLDVDKICRTYEEGIFALGFDGPWDKLYLDHDLGDSYEDEEGIHRELTGYSVMCWLERNPEFLPTEIEFVTANPVGRQNMQRVYTKILETLDESWDYYSDIREEDD